MTNQKKDVYVHVLLQLGCFSEKRTWGGVASGMFRVLAPLRCMKKDLEMALSQVDRLLRVVQRRRTMCRDYFGYTFVRYCFLAACTMYTKIITL